MVTLTQQQDLLFAILSQDETAFDKEIEKLTAEDLNEALNLTLIVPNLEFKKKFNFQVYPPFELSYETYNFIQIKEYCYMLPLAAAIVWGTQSMMEKLLDKQVSIEQKNNPEMPALQYPAFLIVCRWGCAEKVAYFLKKYGNQLINQTTTSDITALEIVFDRKDCDKEAVVKLLFEAGTNLLAIRIHNKHKVYAEYGEDDSLEARVYNEHTSLFGYTCVRQNGYLAKLWFDITRKEREFSNVEYIQMINEAAISKNYMMLQYVLINGGLTALSSDNIQQIKLQEDARLSVINCINHLIEKEINLLYETSNVQADRSARIQNARNLLEIGQLIPHSFVAESFKQNLNELEDPTNQKVAVKEWREANSVNLLKAIIERDVFGFEKELAVCGEADLTRQYKVANLPSLTLMTLTILQGTEVMLDKLLARHVPVQNSQLQDNILQVACQFSTPDKVAKLLQAGAAYYINNCIASNPPFKNMGCTPLLAALKNKSVHNEGIFTTLLEKDAELFPQGDNQSLLIDEICRQEDFSLFNLGFNYLQTKNQLTERIFLIFLNSAIRYKQNSILYYVIINGGYQYFTKVDDKELKRTFPYITSTLIKSVKDLVSLMLKVDKTHNKSEEEHLTKLANALKVIKNFEIIKDYQEIKLLANNIEKEFVLLTVKKEIANKQYKVAFQFLNKYSAYYSVELISTVLEDFDEALTQFNNDIPALFKQVIILLTKMADHDENPNKLFQLLLSKIINSEEGKKLNNINILQEYLQCSNIITLKQLRTTLQIYKEASLLTDGQQSLLEYFSQNTDKKHVVQEIIKLPIIKDDDNSKSQLIILDYLINGFPNLPSLKDDSEPFVNFENIKKEDVQKIDNQLRFNEIANSSYTLFSKLELIYKLKIIDYKLFKDFCTKMAGHNQFYDAVIWNIRPLMEKKNTDLRLILLNQISRDKIEAFVKYMLDMIYLDVSKSKSHDHSELFYFLLTHGGYEIFIKEKEQWNKLIASHSDDSYYQFIKNKIQAAAIELANREIAASKETNISFIQKLTHLANAITILSNSIYPTTPITNMLYRVRKEHEQCEIFVNLEKKQYKEAKWGIDKLSEFDFTHKEDLFKFHLAFIASAIANKEAAKQSLELTDSNVFNKFILTELQNIGTNPDKVNELTKKLVLEPGKEIGAVFINKALVISKLNFILNNKTSSGTSAKDYITKLFKIVTKSAINIQPFILEALKIRELAESLNCFNKKVIIINDLAISYPKFDIFSIDSYLHLAQLTFIHTTTLDKRIKFYQNTQASEFSQSALSEILQTLMREEKAKSIERDEILFSQFLWQFKPTVVFNVFFEIGMVSVVKKDIKEKSTTKKIYDDYRDIINNYTCFVSLFELLLAKENDDRNKYARDKFRSLLSALAKTPTSQSANQIMNELAGERDKSLQTPGPLQGGDNPFIVLIKRICTLDDKNLKNLFNTFKSYLEQGMQNKSFTPDRKELAEHLQAGIIIAGNKFKELHLWLSRKGRDYQNDESTNKFITLLKELNISCVPRSLRGMPGLLQPNTKGVFWSVSVDPIIEKLNELTKLNENELTEAFTEYKQYIETIKDNDTPEATFASYINNQVTFSTSSASVHRFDRFSHGKK